MKLYAVIGLGYVGLGLATALAKKHHVIGYDINSNRVKSLKNHVDINAQIEPAVISNKNILYTDRPQAIQNANFYIVTVSTPAQHYEVPDLNPLIRATETLATVLKKNDIVVFESTVYPGTTEMICIPILEKISHLHYKKDFFVGYSPERINPGDKIHTLKTITKILSACDEKTLASIKNTYLSICDTIHCVSSIATAEAIKILENTQRDVNIALMNEFTKIMHALNLNTHEIIEGAKTKFGFVAYKPGFVGGHCISIDPHYLAFLAKQKGVYPDLILAARKVNDGITQFVITQMMKLMIKNNLETKQMRIGVLGVSYKENTLDTRNSLSLKLIKELKEYGFKCMIHDPLQENYQQMPTDVSVMILTVGHDAYRQMGLQKLATQCMKKFIFMDIPNLFIHEDKKNKNMIYWNL